MKKGISVISLFAALCLLCACAGETEPTKTTETSGEVTTTVASGETTLPEETEPTDPAGTTASTASGASKTAATKSTTTASKVTSATTAAPAAKYTGFDPNVEVYDVAGKKTKDPLRWVYVRSDNDIIMREYTIKSKKGGDPVVIAQLSDLHINMVNDEDLKNPTIASTYQKRTFMRDGKSLENTRKVMTFAKTFADQFVITGDALDYLTTAALSALKTEIWDKYPGTIVTLGNHDYVQQMQGAVAESLSVEERYNILKSGWKHDIFYSSKVLKDKVMLVQLDNGTGAFREEQIAPFTADIEKARKNGYIILVFCHEPLCTHNPNEKSIIALRCDDYSSRSNNNFCETRVGGSGATGATLTVCNLIANNADVVKGVFNGHMHADFYTEIVGKDPQTGKQVMIPQITATGSAYGKGRMVRICVE